MLKYSRIVSVLLIGILLSFLSVAWAAPAPALIQKVRLGQRPDGLRIVMDMNVVPDYKVTLEEEPLRLIIDMPATLDKVVLPQVKPNDPVVKSLEVKETAAGQVRAIVTLNRVVSHRVYALKAPNRLVIDLTRIYDRKVEQEIRPGLHYTSWLKGYPFGPVQSYILNVDLKSGLAIKPVLSNGAVAGLETVGAMSTRARALAAVNGSYFALDGEILGLLKLDGELISTPSLPRSAVGIMPDGRIIIDQVAFSGEAVLPNGRSIRIDGVNRERGANELILYNGYYGAATGSNAYGVEYLINSQGKVLGIAANNTAIEEGCAVLSAHGAAVNALASLKVGDTVVIRESLGPEWDEAVHALGAGPRLVKNGSVFLTTKTEDFGSDVAGGRAPRTALGLTKDGRLLLVVVDGRQTTSAGMTLLELALFMQELGAVDALNLDGGGSSEMVLKDQVLNKPSDGRERKVGDALVVIPTDLAN